MKNDKTQGGITNTESSAVATTTSTVSATDRQPVGYVDRAQLEWLTRSTSDTASVQLWRARTPVIDAVSVYLEGAQKAPEEVRNQALEELRRAVCVIGIVGEIDGHDVIRRESVLNIIEQRTSSTDQANADTRSAE